MINNLYYVCYINFLTIIILLLILLYNENLELTGKVNYF